MELLKVWLRGVLLAPCCALVLYGCGGSSGGGDDDIDPTLQITPTNAGQVAAAAYGSNDDMGEVVEIPSRILSADQSTPPRVTGLLGLALRVLPNSAFTGKQAVTPAVDDNGNCDVRGRATTTLDDSNNNGEIDVVGESGTVRFVDCVDEVNGPTIDGTMTFTLNRANDSEVEFTLRFLDLTIVGGIDDEDLSANGSLTFGARSIDDPPTLILRLRGEDLVLVEDGEPLDLTGNFDFTVTIEFGGDATVAFEYNLRIDSLGGIIHVETTVTLVGNPPESGVVVVEGANSTLTLTFTGGGGVTVALDEDADGTAECSQDLTLDTLEQFNPGLCP